MGFRVLAILVPIFYAPSILAQARATSHGADMALAYYEKTQLATKGEIEAIKKLNDRVKSGDRSLCVGYRGTDMSGCAKHVILRMPPHSAEGLREMLNIPVTAALKDREQGFGDRRSGLLLVDSFLTVVETMNPQKFFARTIRARSKKDREARKLVYVKENALLESFRLQALPTAESHLRTTLEAPPNPDAQVALWEKTTSSTLKARLAKLKNRAWAVR